MISRIVFAAVCFVACGRPAAMAEDPAVPERFTAALPQPQFTGQPGEWDAKIRERGWILREGSQWRMW